MRVQRLLLLALLCCGPLLAAAYRPYPDANISAEQWQEYFDIVQNEFGDTAQELPDVDLLLFHDAATMTFYAFTKAGNPAHPAWITRRIVEQDGEIAVEQIGYFAGDEAAFADLFDAYADITDELRDEFESTATETRP